MAESQRVGSARVCDHDLDWLHNVLCAIRKPTRRELPGGLTDGQSMGWRPSKTKQNHHPAIAWLVMVLRHTQATKWPHLVVSLVVDTLAEQPL